MIVFKNKIGLHNDGVLRMSVPIVFLSSHSKNLEFSPRGILSLDL